MRRHGGGSQADVRKVRGLRAGGQPVENDVTDVLLLINDSKAKCIMINRKNKPLISRFGFNVSIGLFPKKHNSLRSNICFFTEISPGNIINPTLNHSLFLFFTFEQHITK